MSDWATQLQRELMTPADAMGGMGQKDYFRDPSTGYSPQYAPRDFLDGGAVAYAHPNSPVRFTEAAAQRRWLDHDVDQTAAASHMVRETSRRMSSDADRHRFVESTTPRENLWRQLPRNESMNPVDQLRSNGPLSGEKMREQMMVDRYQAARGGAAPLSYSAGTDMSSGEWVNAMDESTSTTGDNALDEALRLSHGLRAKELHDFKVMQRLYRPPFQGYDRQRFAAQREGRPYGAQLLPAPVPVSSMEEAQKNLRTGGVPASVAELQKAFATNTTSDEPKLGEALTADALQSLHAHQESTKLEKDLARRQRFGLGRQGALVQDGGPDRRVLKKHANDERLVDALHFTAGAYRQTSTDEHKDPYLRRNTDSGVGHLLTNKFDQQRREDRVANGKSDLTERQTIHYGVPVQQSIDEFVLTHRNARGDRPLDYFKPFPDFRAQRLNRMYQDVEGFSLMKQRPETLEWELFTRYRAHHQQRRYIALLHGLEPTANETAEECRARVQALDALCERTPFDPAFLQLQDEDEKVGVEVLRSWFGVYMLPSPPVTEAVTRADGALNLHLQHLNDEFGTADTREHVLSSRYFNRLLLFEGFRHRWNRGFTSEVVGRAPEPSLPLAQPPAVMQYWSAEERAMMQEYVQQETAAQVEKWSLQARGRRYLVEKRQYGEVVAQGFRVAVVEVQHADTGARLTISAKKFEAEIAEATAAVAEGGNHTPSPNSASAPMIRIDGEPYLLVASSARSVVPLSVKLESGEMMEMSDEDFGQLPLEVAAEASYNHALNYGIADYAYNRGNYIETQDFLWAQETTKGVEGWSPTTHADGLRPGLPVRARRRLAKPTGGSPDTEAAASGDLHRGRIVQYQRQPFFNPEPRLVTIAFEADGEVQQVPLSDVMIWQRRYYGPDRTTGDASRRHNPMGLRRYIDVTDPTSEKGGFGDTAGGVAHFLDKYVRRGPSGAAAVAAVTAAKYRTTKQITEIDQWNRFDTTRPENYRPLSISHRKDYIRQGYIHRYTPWEWIAIQEADQPLIQETIREDNVGASFFFSLNRYWRYKARPHGYLHNFTNEVRDLFQYVDGVTPWRQAQKIRTYWEVRQHHPMPQFNRPEVAMHRNTAGLLPAHLWETDKKTGKVKSVKDSVRDYQTKTPLPKWVQL